MQHECYEKIYIAFLEIDLLRSTEKYNLYKERESSLNVQCARNIEFPVAAEFIYMFRGVRNCFRVSLYILCIDVNSFIDAGGALLAFATICMVCCNCMYI